MPLIKAYEAGFGKRVVECKDTGHAFKEACETFGVDSKRYYSWKRQLERAGSLKRQAPKEGGGKTGGKELARSLGERPGWRLGKLAERFSVSPRAAREMFERLGVACKKKRSRARKSLRKDGMPFRVESSGRRRKSECMPCR